GHLLDAAGYVDQDGDGVRDANGAPFRFNLDVSAGMTLRSDMAIMIQEDLARLGIDVRINPLERRLNNTRHRAGNFDAFIGAWRLPTKVDLSVIFHTRAIKNGGNFGGYSNVELDDLLERAEQVTEARAAKPLFDAAQEIIHREQPYTFLYWQSRLVGISSRVRDAAPNAQSPLFHLERWWVERPAEHP
ncbi:MAG: ABC transporter substrate-binding protein, partial [Acidobacteriota bacterium]